MPTLLWRFVSFAIYLLAVFAIVGFVSPARARHAVTRSIVEIEI